MEAGDEEEEEVQEVRRPMGRDRAKKKAAASFEATDIDEALARLMVTKYERKRDFLSMKKKDRVTFFEIKRMELKMQQRRSK